MNLMREIRRVVDGSLYIKDHVSAGLLDDLRLGTLDAIGNIPFGGMVKAQYLSAVEWLRTSRKKRLANGETATLYNYRSGDLGGAVPLTGLETTMRFDPV